MRLIDADALQNLFNEVSTSLLGKPDLAKDVEHMVRAFIMTTEMIQDAPTVDAVPVVRCKDCKHRSKYDRHWCAYWMVGVSSVGFCNHGERKTK